MVGYEEGGVLSLFGIHNQNCAQKHRPVRPACYPLLLLVVVAFFYLGHHGATKNCCAAIGSNRDDFLGEWEGW